MNSVSADNILMKKISKIHDIITPGGFGCIKKDYERIKNRLEENRDEKNKSN